MSAACPRSAAVVDMLMARENGTAYDPAAFAAVMTGAVSEVVAQQRRCGVDIVSDGEVSKISYATYIKDRLSGFAGDSPRQVARDLQPYPDFPGPHGDLCRQADIQAAVLCRSDRGD